MFQTISKSLFCLLLLCSALFAFSKKANAAVDDITLNYPTCNGSTVLCDDLADGQWRFKFHYTLESIYDFDTAIVSLGSNCDTYYENCNNWPADLKDLDPYQTGYFWTPSDTPNPITVDETTRVYRVDLLTDHSGDSFLFNTVHSTNENPQQYNGPIPPPTYNCGDLGQWLCDLFIPDQEHLELFTQGLPDDMGARIPFAYISDASDFITSLQEALAGKKNKQGNADFKSIYEAKQQSKLTLSDRAEIKYNQIQNKNNTIINPQEIKTLEQTVIFEQTLQDYDMAGQSNYFVQNFDNGDMGYPTPLGNYESTFNQLKVRLKSSSGLWGKFIKASVYAYGDTFYTTDCTQLISDNDYHDYTLNFVDILIYSSTGWQWEIDLSNTCNASSISISGLTVAGSSTNPLDGLGGYSPYAHDAYFQAIYSHEVLDPNPNLLTIPLDIDGTVKWMPIFDPVANATGFGNLKTAFTPYITMVVWLYVLSHIAGRVMDMIL